MDETERQSGDRGWETAKTLAEALPYIQIYDRKTVVIKYGGHAMGESAVAKQFAAGACAVTLATISQVRMFRAFGVREVILATNFTAEGETTAHVITQGLKDRGIRITRLARGVPVGSELEYVDLGTIAHALVDRR